MLCTCLSFSYTYFLRFKGIGAQMASGFDGKSGPQGMLSGSRVRLTNVINVTKSRREAKFSGMYTVDDGEADYLKAENKLWLMTETLKNNKPSCLNHTELDFTLRSLYDDFNEKSCFTSRTAFWHAPFNIYSFISI